MPANIRKPLTEVAMLLMTRPARTEAGRKVHAKVLAAVEADIAMIARINAYIAEEI
jgi:hypothetical protein